MTIEKVIEEVQFNMSHIGLGARAARRVKEAKRMAIQALEEIQQYRAIGTVEEILNTFNTQQLKIASQHNELEEYRAIGTVEGYENAINAYTETYILMKEYKSKLQDFESIGTVDEFKALKEKEERFDRNIKMFNEIGLEIRAKVIDEFAERLKAESFSGYVTLEDYYEDTVECVSVEDIDEIAEQLKAGGKNE